MTALPRAECPWCGRSVPVRRLIVVDDGRVECPEHGPARATDVRSETGAIVYRCGNQLWSGL